MALLKRCRHAAGLKGPARMRAWRACRCAWAADFHVAGSRQHRNLGHDFDLARREYDRIERELGAGRVPHMAEPDTMGFEAVADAWWAVREHGLAPNTRAGYLAALAHTRNWFGSQDVRGITAAQLAEMEAAQLAAGRAPSYVRHIRAMAKAVLSYAVDCGYIDAVPAPRLRLPRTQKEPRVIAPDMMERLLEAIDPPFRAVTECTWLTGMRAGEAMGVRHLDVEGAVLNVRRNRVQSTGEFRSTKGRMARPVDLSERARGCLPAPAGREERLFPTNYGSWLRAWHEALMMEGVEQCGLHTLRHSNVALRLVAGQPLPYVARQLGHGSADFTLRVYGRWIPSDRDDAALLDATAQRLASSAATPAAPAPNGRPADAARRTGTRRGPARSRTSGP